MPKTILLATVMLAFFIWCAHKAPEIVFEDPYHSYERSVTSSLGSVKFLSDTLGVYEVIVEALSYKTAALESREQIKTRVIENVYHLLTQHFQYVHGSLTQDSAIIRNCIESKVNRYDFRVGFRPDSSAYITYAMGHQKIGAVLNCMEQNRAAGSTFTP